MSASKVKRSNEAEVLAKALLNASSELSLKQTELAKALGVDLSALNKLKSSCSLDPSSKKGEIALALVRIASSLHILTDGDREWMKRFMHSENNGTRGIPAEQISTISGLKTVLRYVDAMRGKV